MKDTIEVFLLIKHTLCTCKDISGPQLTLRTTQSRQTLLAVADKNGYSLRFQIQGTGLFSTQVQNTTPA